ncbi:MAG TPA: hypothetical protein VM848_13955 [Acidimicrobiia bacterium]|nr:hypothetical protein [Acidimicrobiia bacterium]
MSYSDTFADRRSASWNRYRIQAAMVGVSLALGMTIGFALAPGSSEAHSAIAAPASGAISQEEFLRLNTTALEALTPRWDAPTSPTVVDRGFLYLNTVALDALGTPDVPAAQISRVSDAFLHWNIESLERPATPVVDRPGFPK